MGDIKPMNLCNICHQKEHGYKELCPEWHNDERMENYGSERQEAEKKDTQAEDGRLTEDA